MPTAAELELFDDDELETRLANSRKELFNLRFQLATGRLDNSARIGQMRREIARALTVRRDREIARAEGRLPELGATRAPRSTASDEEE